VPAALPQSPPQLRSFAGVHTSAMFLRVRVQSPAKETDRVAVLQANFIFMSFGQRRTRRGAAKATCLLGSEYGFGIGGRSHWRRGGRGRRGRVGRDSNDRSHWWRRSVEDSSEDRDRCTRCRLGKRAGDVGVFEDIILSPVRKAVKIVVDGRRVGPFEHLHIER
jgi:hypothetical protein